MGRYGDEMNGGLYVGEGGYYFGMREEMEVKVLGEMFRKGCWGLWGGCKYNKGYKLSGWLNGRYVVRKRGEKKMGEYCVWKELGMEWSDGEDGKGNGKSWL